MSLHPSTFDYVKPTDYQLMVMQRMRKDFADFSTKLAYYLPDGPDKTYLLRRLREVAMWANVAITRHPDGSPRTKTEEITP